MGPLDPCTVTTVRTHSKTSMKKNETIDKKTKKEKSERENNNRKDKTNLRTAKKRLEDALL